VFRKLSQWYYGRYTFSNLLSITFGKVKIYPSKLTKLWLLTKGRKYTLRRKEVLIRLAKHRERKVFEKLMDSSEDPFFKKLKEQCNWCTGPISIPFFKKDIMEVK
jgi:hypothetical protein